MPPIPCHARQRASVPGTGMACPVASAIMFGRAGLVAHGSRLDAGVIASGCPRIARERPRRTDGSPPAAPPADTWRRRAWCGRSTVAAPNATLRSRRCSPRPPRRRRRPAWRRFRTGTGWRRPGQRPAGEGPSMVRAVTKEPWEQRVSHRPGQQAGTQSPAMRSIDAYRPPLCDRRGAWRRGLPAPGGGRSGFPAPRPVPPSGGRAAGLGARPSRDAGRLFAKGFSRRAGLSRGEKPQAAADVRAVATRRAGSRLPCARVGPE